MSYILEALRRSQAERERGLVPGVHAQPAAAEAAPAPRRTGAWLVGGLALALALLLALAALWWRPAAVPAQAAVLPPAPAAAPVPAATPRPLPLPLVVSAPVATPPPATPPTTPPTRTAEAAAPAASAAAERGPLPAAPASRALTLSQLTPEQRRELPSMTLGGSVWSDNAASRVVIVNGQLVHEGETAAPGVVVERIAPRAVWLRWRDLRLELAL